MHARLRRGCGVATMRPRSPRYIALPRCLWKDRLALCVARRNFGGARVDLYPEKTCTMFPRWRAQFMTRTALARVHRALIIFTRHVLRIISRRILLLHNAGASNAAWRRPRGGFIPYQGENRRMGSAGEWHGQGRVEEPSCEQTLRPHS